MGGRLGGGCLPRFGRRKISAAAAKGAHCPMQERHIIFVDQIAAHVRSLSMQSKRTGEIGVLGDEFAAMLGEAAEGDDPHLDQARMLHQAVDGRFLRGIHRRAELPIVDDDELSA